MIQFTYKLKLNERSGKSAVATPAITQRRTPLPAFVADAPHAGTSIMCIARG